MTKRKLVARPAGCAGRRGLSFSAQLSSSSLSSLKSVCLRTSNNHPLHALTPSLPRPILPVPRPNLPTPTSPSVSPRRAPRTDDEPSQLRPLTSSPPPCPTARLDRPATTIASSSGPFPTAAYGLRERLPTAAAAAAAAAAGRGEWESLRTVWTAHERPDGAGGGAIRPDGVQAWAGVSRAECELR